MNNRKLIWILPALLVAIGLLWFYSTRDSGQLDRKKALEERISRIAFTAEALLPSEANMLETGPLVTINRLKRNEMSDSTLPNANKYLNSLCVGMLQATYQLNGNTINVEIAQFASSSDSYGFYAQKRPSGILLDSVGSESYYLNDTLYFNKGEFAVMVTLAASSEQRQLIKTTAKIMADKISTQTVLPMFFRLFPYRGQLVPSLKYYSLNFLGVEGLDEVYTIDYAVDEDTLTLFLTMDTAGAKFVELSDWGNDFGEVSKAPEQFDYPEQFSLSFEHPQYGQIVAGMANRKLAGVIGYNRATGIELGTRWIKGLQ